MSYSEDLRAMVRVIKDEVVADERFGKDETVTIVCAAAIVVSLTKLKNVMQANPNEA